MSHKTIDELNKIALEEKAKIEEKIIGRRQEQSVLSECYGSDKAELVAVYGRRRVGKTFLVKNFFKFGSRKLV